MRASVALRWRYVALAAASLLALGACGDGQVQRIAGSAAVADTGFVSGAGVVTVVAVEERKPAPQFGGPLLGGGTFDLADARGEVVVLNVWGSWCAPCRSEAPGLQAVSAATAGQGVRFVGVNTRDTEAGALAFVREFGITYDSVVDTDSRALLAFRDTLPPAAIPTTLIIDRAGRIAVRVVGEISEATLRELVDQIAGEASAGG